MDAVRIEHLFADALGVERGKRGDVNDADYVRSGQAKYLVKALNKALKNLKKRAEKMPKSDSMKIWVDSAIGDMGIEADHINKFKDKISDSPACLSHWSLCAISLNLIDVILRRL